MCRCMCVRLCACACACIHASPCLPPDQCCCHDHGSFSVFFLSRKVRMCKCSLYKGVTCAYMLVQSMLELEVCLCFKCVYASSVSMLQVCLCFKRVYASSVSMLQACLCFKCVYASSVSAHTHIRHLLGRQLFAGLMPSSIYSHT
jgi:hypothetical protein